MELGNLTEVGLDIFTGLLKLYAKTHSLRVEIPFNEVYQQLEINLRADGNELYKVGNSDRLKKQLDDVGSALSKMFTRYADEHKIQYVPLYQWYEADLDNHVLTIIWNEFQKDWLEDISSNALYLHKTYYLLKNKYAKILYFQFSEWNNKKNDFYKSTGRCHKIFTVDEFRRIMGIADKKAYSNGTSAIWQKIINPSIKELEPYFLDLQCITHKKGKKVTSFEFSWIPEDKIVLTDKQKKAIEMKEQGIEPKKQPKKNSFKNFEERKYQFDENGMPIIED